MITLPKTATRLVIAGLLLGLTQSTYTLNLKCTPHLAKWGAVMLTTASVIAVYKRKPTNDFKPRYDIQQVTQFNKILTKEYWENIWYIYYDGFIGQKGSEKYLKSEDDRIVVDEEIEAQGLLGNATEFVKPIKDAAGSLGLAYLVYKVATAHPSGKRKLYDENGNPRLDKDGNHIEETIETTIWDIISLKSKAKDALHSH